MADISREEFSGFVDDIESTLTGASVSDAMLMAGIMQATVVRIMIKCVGAEKAAEKLYQTADNLAGAIVDLRGNGS